MKNKYLLLFPLICLLLVACNRRESTPLRNTDLDRQQIRDMLNAYTRAVGEKGLLAEFDYLDSSADFYWIPPGYTDALGYDSIAAILRRNAPTLRKLENNYELIRLNPICDGMFSYSARVQSRVTDSTGHTGTHQLIETGLIVRRGTEWKLLSGQTGVLQ